MSNLYAQSAGVASSSLELLVAQKLTREIADPQSDIFSQWTQLGWKAFKPHRWVAFTVFGWGIIFDPSIRSD